MSWVQVCVEFSDDEVTGFRCETRHDWHDDRDDHWVRLVTRNGTVCLEVRTLQRALAAWEADQKRRREASR